MSWAPKQGFLRASVKGSLRPSLHRRSGLNARKRSPGLSRRFALALDSFKGFAGQQTLHLAGYATSPFFRALSGRIEHPGHLKSRSALVIQELFAIMGISGVSSDSFPD